MIRYHVAGETYEPGDSLISRDRLTEAGYEIAWKWDEADEGFDGDVVCLFEALAEAQEFRIDCGGTILAVTIPDQIEDQYQTEHGYITPRIVRVAEGYIAVTQGIPAEWIAKG